MLLVVGDVVRDHRDSALGIVAGLAEAPGPNLVVVRMSGGFVRLCEPHVLHLVARRSRPLTKSQSIAVTIAVLCAVTAAYLGARAAYELGELTPVSWSP
ncbi:hypothetical protein [Streptomyces sp. CC228A]|uniref:hypothetical protein n=1 Tax=Streptomyces sp. CC228A TaxID=2898186 RepID=UPI001F32B9BE|nr:hypothetical protein [Streptomyces sp. CC228A]